jgi:hypothetical protein
VVYLAYSLNSIFLYEERKETIGNYIYIGSYILIETYLVPIN